MPTQLRFTVSARELREQKKGSFLGEKIADLAIGFLEKYFGTEILLYIPPALQEVDLSIFDVIKKAEKLQEIGAIKKIKKHPKFSDEPFLYNFSATLQRTDRVISGLDFFSEKAAILKALVSAAEKESCINEEGLLKKHRLFLHGKNSLQNMNASHRNKSFAATATTVSKTLEESIVKGILGIIKNNACTASRLNKLSPAIIDFEYLSFQDENVEKVYKLLKRYDLEAYLLKLDTGLPVNVILAVILDKSDKGPAFSFASSANLDLKSAILDAITDTMSERFSLKKNWKLIEKTKDSDKKKSDLENILSSILMLNGKKTKIDLSEESNFFQGEALENKSYYKNALQALIKGIEGKNYQVWHVEISTQAIRSLGMFGSKVVIPELQLDRGL